MKTKNKTITIRVTKDDIRLGKRGDATACPVALACKRSLKHKVFVPGDDEIEIAGGDGDIDAPRSIGRFVDRFDTKKPVKPFTFKLKLTPEVIDFLDL